MSQRIQLSTTYGTSQTLMVARDASLHGRPLTRVSSGSRLQQNHTVFGGSLWLATPDLWLARLADILALQKRMFAYQIRIG
jgi:hypothetical protein